MSSSSSSLPSFDGIINLDGSTHTSTPMSITNFARLLTARKRRKLLHAWQPAASPQPVVYYYALRGWLGGWAAGEGGGKERTPVAAESACLFLLLLLLLPKRGSRGIRNDSLSYSLYFPLRSLSVSPLPVSLRLSRTSTTLSFSLSISLLFLFLAPLLPALTRRREAGKTTTPRID